MMKQCLIVFCLCVIFGSSCKKTENPSHGHGNSQSPVYKDAPKVPIDTNTVWGVMYTIKDAVAGEDEWSWFYNDSRTAYIKMGNITFNGQQAYGLCYWPSDTPYPIYPVGLYHNTNSGNNGPCTSFYMTDSVSWIAVSDSNNISIHYNFIGHFPEYVGAIPTSARIADGLTLQIDSTTLVGADSVQIVITSSSSQSVKKAVFVTNQGSVNIDLTAFSTSSNINVATTAYKILIKTFNGKDYAFIKQGNNSYNTVQLIQ